jgi:hypothetical protein
MVETPAGKFNAVKIRSANANDKVEEGTSWWSVDTGIVKHEHRLYISELVKITR